MASKIVENWKRAYGDKWEEELEKYVEQGREMRHRDELIRHYKEATARERGQL